MESYSQQITMFPELPSSSKSTHNCSTNKTMISEKSHTADVDEMPRLPFSLSFESQQSISTDSGGEMISAVGAARIDNVSDRTQPPQAAGKVGKKIKKQRYAFQTRSPVDILDDGFRWRKYGQKAVKNSKFPRSYYKCAYEGCNVKKQVQRLSKDEAVVVTTYEGIHTHSDSDTDKCSDNFEHILSQMQIYTS